VFSRVLRSTRNVCGFVRFGVRGVSVKQPLVDMMQGKTLAASPDFMKNSASSRQTLSNSPSKSLTSSVSTATMNGEFKSPLRPQSAMGKFDKSNSKRSHTLTYTGFLRAMYQISRWLYPSMDGPAGFDSLLSYTFTQVRPNVDKRQWVQLLSGTLATSDAYNVRLVMDKFQGPLGAFFKFFGNNNVAKGSMTLRQFFHLVSDLEVVQPVSTMALVR
jgi:hypothetical protein